MNKVIIASMKMNSGKTSVIAGMMEACGKKFSYMKPLGDRMLYRKKRLWDYDSSTITSLFSLQENPEDMSIGFDHSKLRYMYDEAGMKTKINESLDRIDKNKEVLFVECGKDISCGSSVFLDPISIAKNVGGKIYIVVAGNDDRILDDITFIKKEIDFTGVNFGGVIINKIQNFEDFKSVHLPKIQAMGVNVVGMIPFQPELTHYTVGYLAERLFAKVITGENNLNSKVKNIFIGAMSSSSVSNNPLFQKENKIIITSGDRSDMLLTAIETKSVGVILTNNFVPPSNIISKAEEMKIPLLLVPSDTFQTAKQIDTIDPLLTKDDSDKKKLLARIAKENINLKEIVG